MDRRVGLVAVTTTLLALLFALLGAIPALSLPTRADARPAAAARDALIVTTHGSRWFHFEDTWAYPAFKPFADRLDVVTTIPLDRLLDQYPDLHLATRESRWFTYTLEAPLDGSLVFDLKGSSSNFNGLFVNLWIRDPTEARFVHIDRTYERSWHLDQPAVGEYQVEVDARSPSTCTLQIGAAQSPYLTTALDSFSFLLLPDTDPLSQREVERIQRFVQDGGNLVVLAEYVRGPRYYMLSDLASLNQVLTGCGIALTGQLLTTTQTFAANWQAVNVLTDIRPHPVTRAITQVIAPGSTLNLSESAQGLVFDDQGDPVVAVGTHGMGQCLVLGTATGFNADFNLKQNDQLAANIVEWASKRMSYQIFLPVTARDRQ